MDLDDVQVVLCTQLIDHLRDHSVESYYLPLPQAWWPNGSPIAISRDGAMQSR